MRARGGAELRVQNNNADPLQNLFFLEVKNLVLFLPYPLRQPFSFTELKNPGHGS
jgi:hypothetical protein